MRTSYSVAVFASLALFWALPVVADDSGTSGTNLAAVPSPPAATLPQPYDWKQTGVASPAMDGLPDERMGPAERLSLMAAALLAVAASVLGLTITFLSLRREMRQKHVVYRPRGRFPVATTHDGEHSCRPEMSPASIMSRGQFRE